MTVSMLHGSRVYLSGPMDFVGSRVIEKYLGWRAIITPVATALGVRVLDPWNKPDIRGHQNYGREGVLHSKNEYETDFWVSEETRARFETDFWETVHIDLRMTDVADFLISFVPTNIYSVGTVHEIITARNQHKPVLMVSPPVRYDFFPELAALSAQERKALKYYGLKENPKGIPSQWYGNIVGGRNMFDGFGWEALPFKSEDFYPSLINEVLEISRPDRKDELAYDRWQQVKQWVGQCEGLHNLKGGILDNIELPDNFERQLLEREMAKPTEEARQYFWYNTPYTPQRPLLYQFFNIASGYIPPRLHVVSHLDSDGNMAYSSYECVDDNWTLIAPVTEDEDV